MLSQAAKLMLRALDIAIRWRPAGFLFVLPMFSVSTAREVAVRIREAAQGVRSRDMPAITVSGSVVELSSGGDPETAVGQLLEQLNAARKHGGNRIY